MHACLKIKILLISTDYSEDHLLQFCSSLIFFCFCIEHLCWLDILLTSWMYLADLGLFYMKNLGFLHQCLSARFFKNESWERKPIYYIIKNSFTFKYFCVNFYTQMEFSLLPESTHRISMNPGIPTKNFIVLSHQPFKIHLIKKDCIMKVDKNCGKNHWLFHFLIEI